MKMSYQSLLRTAELVQPNSLFHVRGVTDRRVALTIDDGPSHRTGEILDILRDAGHHATFFIHTDRLEPTPEGVRLIERMLEEGHEVANHMPDTRTSVRLSAGEFASEFARAHRALRDIGQPPQFFRAAGGFFHVARMLPALRDLGYFERFIMASYLPWDTHLPFPTAYARHLIDGAFPGAIFVLHDGEDGTRNRAERTLRTLEKLAWALPSRGFRMDTLGNLLDESAPS